jgi:6-pyruvoyltetrahydropterin/6-carboxytetrahydropterin synthase
MIIRKLFKFENAHIVRNCSTKKCKYSIHGHSYKCEVLLESSYLDDGQMIYDFGLMKLSIKDFIESFDHSISIWSKDSKEYIKFAKKFSRRWVELPVSPSAEQLSRVLFLLVDRVLNQTILLNGEKSVILHSIIVHETDTGYAQCFKDDAYSSSMGKIELDNIVFSKEIKKSWIDKDMFKKLLNEDIFINPTEL